MAAWLPLAAGFVLIASATLRGLSWALAPGLLAAGAEARRESTPFGGADKAAMVRRAA